MNNPILYHQPGQQVTLLLETLDINGVRQDSSTLPVISQIIFPNLGLAANYPQNMSKLDTGLYYYKFSLPGSAIAVGTYIVDLTYTDPADSILKTTFTQIVVTSPFGNYSAGSS